MSVFKLFLITTNVYKPINNEASDAEAIVAFNKGFLLICMIFLKNIGVISVFY